MGAFSLLITLLALANALAWSRCVAAGRVEATWSRPLYDPLPLPVWAEGGAAGHLGCDYATLYLAARSWNRGDLMYDVVNDPWWRLGNTYPPVLVAMTAYTTARSEFVTAALTTTLAQVLLFLLACGYYLAGGPTPPAIRLAGGAVALFLMFCTPVGATWIERGQTDFFVAAGSLMLLKAMRDGRVSDAAIAGLLGGLKWSSLPVFAMLAAPYLIVGHGSRWRRVTICAVALGLPFVLLLPFHEAGTYIGLVRDSELLDKARGASLSLYGHRALAKSLILCLPLLYIALQKRSRGRGGLELVYLSIAGIVGATFGTLAYEYRFMATLYILPLLLDGRSVYGSSEGHAWGPLPRFIAGLTLAWAMRLETVGAVDALVGSHRGLVPLVGGCLVLCALAMRPPEDHAQSARPPDAEGEVH